MRMLAGLIMLLPVAVLAESLRQIDYYDVWPNQYGKYGVTPIFGPVTVDGLQTLTLILKQHSRHGVLASITLHYLDNRGDLHFSAPLRYQCMDDKNRCFLEFAIEARYENNLEIELLYQTLNDPERVIEYRIKDIGVMSSLLQKKR